jgi:hypothetical protein
MHCETQQRSLPRLLTLNAPMTGLRIPRAMNLPSRGRRVNISNASPLWVSEIDLNNVPFRPRRPAAGKPMSRCGPSRRFQRLTTSVAIGEERTWLDLPLVPPGRE